MKFSETHRNNIKQSKLNFAKSNYHWETVEPYLDIEIKNGSRNRKHKFITLREFKRLRTETNKTIKELSKMGYSRQILGFYSRFCQGKISISKSILEEEYKKNNLDFISKKYKIDRGDLACLRQLYGINSTSGPYFKRLEREKPFSQRQKEIIYGSLLGDACCINNKRLSFKHGDCQREYIFWKFDELKEHCSEKSLKAYRNISEKYNLDSVCWQFRTLFNSDCTPVFNQFYGEGKKQVTKEIIENLTLLSIAVWYMDDGSTNFNYKEKERTGYNIKPVPSFCTDSFSIESCELLSKFLKNKFGISNRLRKTKKLKNGDIPYNIIINKESFDDFISLIEPYIIPSMKYKIDYETYKKKRVESERCKS